MRYALLCSALITGTVVLGCDRSQSPAEPETPAPSFRNEATVVHAIEPQIFAFVDFEAGYTALLGIKPEEAAAICADPDFAPYDESRLLLVIKPHTGAHKVRFIDHEQQFVIWEGLPNGRISCTFQNVTPIAVGTLHSTETNTNVFDVPAPGATVWHYRATGKLTNPVTGQQYHAKVTTGGFAPPHGEFEFEPDVIRLEPIGGR
jgi:hypothetical protein